MKMVYFVIALICIGIFVSFFSRHGHAQTDSSENISRGIASYLPIEGTSIFDGAIVVSSDKGYALSTTPYDAKIFGVITTNPIIVLNADGDSKKYPVISQGLVQVMVTAQNGAIKEGDFITTSATAAGLGMKATQAGYVLGTAAESFNATNPSDTKKININIKVHYFTNQLTFTRTLNDLVNASINAFYQDPFQMIKYVASGIILLVSLLFGCISLAKSTIVGLEAIGRNPLARTTIQHSMLINCLISVAIIAGGATFAWFILRL